MILFVSQRIQIKLSRKKPTIGAWVFVIDGFDTATEVEFDILLNETRVKRTQMSVLVINAAHNIRDAYRT